jgi:hypothetical protein
MTTIPTVVLFVLGLGLVIVCAEKLVKAAVGTARGFGLNWSVRIGTALRSGVCDFALFGRAGDDGTGPFRIGPLRLRLRHGVCSRRGRSPRGGFRQSRGGSRGDTLGGVAAEPQGQLSPLEGRQSHRAGLPGGRPKVPMRVQP